MKTVYSHSIFSWAMDDFLQTLERGSEDYHEAVRRFAAFLYGRTRGGDGARYFLDKTARYYLIVDFLAAVFPEAKFILLFRNPLEVFASILATWYEGRFDYRKNYIDVHEGPVAMARGAERLGDRALSVHYEDLVSRPEETATAICRFLEIEYVAEMVEAYRTVPLKGRMGDPGKALEYDAITKAPLDKWKSVLNTRYRLWFARRYVQNLGDEVLRFFGESVEGLIKDMDSLKSVRPGSLRDFRGHAGMHGEILLNPEHFREAWRAVRKRKPFYPLR